MKIIADIQLKRLSRLLKEKDMQLHISDEALVLLGELGFNPLMGARPLNRVIQTRIQDPLAEDIIAGKIKPGETIYVSVKEDQLVIGTNDIPEGAKESDAQGEKEENETR